MPPTSWRALRGPAGRAYQPAIRGCPSFTRQHRIVLENSGRIDPERIEDYIAADGYLALEQGADEMTPAAGDRGNYTRAVCAGAAARAIRPG